MNGVRAQGDTRGSAYDRRRRRAWLVELHGLPRKRDGRKTRICCFHCKKPMKASGQTWEVDRFPVCGHDGGRYTRDNIVPSCKSCNATRCHPNIGSCRRSRGERHTPQLYLAFSSESP